VSRRLFLIHWNKAEAQSLAQELHEQGWQVEVEAEDGQRASKRILANPPLAVIISLTRLPSHGRETAAFLRTRPTGKDLPIYFVGGSDDVQRTVKEKVVGALFLPSEALLAKFAELAASGA
jgi:DNA-binding response OmpR family regulator